MSSKKHIPALDGLRGSAVLGVLLFHLGGGTQSHNRLIHLFGVVTHFGYLGVSLFFVLSGFLITGILWDSKGQPSWWRNFFVRRSLRIFPLYYGSLLLNVIVSALAGFNWHTIGHLWIYVLYLQNFVSLGRALHVELPLVLKLPMYHYWSLAVEEQFYLIWPWILLRMRTIRQAQLGCLAVILLSTAVNICLHLHLLPWIHVTFLSTAGGLATGALLAMTSRTDSWPRIAAWAPAALLLGFCGFLAVEHLGISQPPLELPFLWLFFSGALTLCLKPGLMNRIMSVRWLCWVGTISYGLYIFHVLLLPLTKWIVTRIAGSNVTLGLELKLVVGMAVSFAAAALSFRFFEKPFLSLKKKYPSANPIAKTQTEIS